MTEYSCQGRQELKRHKQYARRYKILLPSQTIKPFTRRNFQEEGRGGVVVCFKHGVMFTPGSFELQYAKPNFLIPPELRKAIPSYNRVNQAVLAQVDRFTAQDRCFTINWPENAV